MRCTGPGGGPGAAADPAVRGAGGRAVRRVAGGAGDLPEVRAGCPQLCGGPAVADVGLCMNEVSHLDLADVKWDLRRFGKLHPRLGEGARGFGPRERMVPLINGARATLCW